MLNIFSNKPTDVKGVRHAVLQFIKEQLQKNEGGEGGIIKGLQLFINCTDEERHVYESAVFAGEEDCFAKDEVQRIADDFAIDLPEDWKMEILFTDDIPARAIRAANIPVSLMVLTNRTQTGIKAQTAYIKVLNGVTPEAVYKMESSEGRINIGREEKVQAADGFFRKNNIAFTGDVDNTANRSVSRQHAHIEWDKNNGGFCLYADEGGIPPYNKIKVRSEGGEPWKLQTTNFGYKLKEGDQIILGESAVLEFSMRENG